MKQILYAVCLLILMWPRSVQAQIPGNATMVPFPGTPTGNCNSRQLALDQSNGSLYTCVGAGNTNNGTWQLVAGGGGGGGAITSVFGRTGAIAAQAGDYSVSQVTGAAGLTSPGFTGTPTAPTAVLGTNTTQLATTAFVLANTGGGGGGNATGLNFGGTSIPLGTPAPTTGQFLAFDGTHIVGGTPSGGGGGGLLGCSTPTSGSLVCDTSVQGGTGPVGLLTMPYSSSGLPSPPSTALAAIAADAAGHLFWSPGNNTQFSAIGGAGGTTPPPAGVATFNGRSGPVMPIAADYSAFFQPIGGGGATGVATQLLFGATTLNLSATAPGANECLAVNVDTIVGTPCGGGGGGVLGGVTIIP